MPIEDDAPGLRICTNAVRIGQDVTVYVFPAGRFGESRIVDGMPVPLGERRRGTIAHVEPYDCPGHDGDEEWFIPGVRVTFEDGTEWEGVGHALATWHGGPEPSLADVKAAEAAEADNHAHNELAVAAYLAEGALCEFGTHPGTDDEDEPVVCVHTPWDDEDDEPIMVTPEQAEAFALRLLREATLVRLLRSGAIQADHGHE